MRSATADEDQVVSITDARTAHSEDMDRRTKRYLISMAIRTVCFVLAVITPSPFRWFFAAGAVFLPYIAVIIANAGYRKMVIVSTAQPVRAPRAATDATPGEPKMITATMGRSTRNQPPQPTSGDQPAETSASASTQATETGPDGANLESTR